MNNDNGSGESDRLQLQLATSRENEERFAAANARIADRAESLDMAATPLPFLCECSEQRCTQLVRLSLDEYRAARAHPGTAFILLPGHDDQIVERVVLRTERYLLVKKFRQSREADPG